MVVSGFFCAVRSEECLCCVFFQPGQEMSDISILMKDLETQNTEMKKESRKIKRRIPQDSSSGGTPLSYPDQVKSLI